VSSVGDRVNIYLPMVPEAAVAMLACARIGAAHSVVFGGFSSQALADRINDAEAKVLVTADGGYRRGEVFPLKPSADEAIAHTPTIEHVVVVKRGGNDVDHGRRPRSLVPRPDGAPPTRSARPNRWTPSSCCSCSTPAGTTGKPKGIMHTSGGYLTHVTYTHKYVFDLHPETDVFWCTADVGWVTGHSYIVYGPIVERRHPGDVRGSAQLSRADDRFWEIVEKYGVTLLYTAPTAIRTMMKWGARGARQARPVLVAAARLAWVSRSTPRRGCGTTSTSAASGCPIVDTWWQTETGGIMISPLPGATTTKPGSATFPLPGVSAEVVDDNGEVVDPRRRLSHVHASVAGHAARHLGRSRALSGDLLEPVSGTLLRRRRRQARQTTATCGCSAGSTT
jgi:acetyl-CoA synthetase